MTPDDPDEVIRRWERRRWKVQQREAAIQQIREAVYASALFRWLDFLARLLKGVSRDH